MDKKQLNQRGFGHILLFILFIVVIGVVAFAGWHVANKNHHSSTGSSTEGDANSSDALSKGKALSNNECTGQGSTSLTHAPMDIKDIGHIDPMGLMVGGHVTPIDHEYYFQKDENAPYDTYPVYADADGIITAVQYVNDGTKPAWWVTISHTCTFLSNYNLMTSIPANIKSQLPKGWGPNANGGVHIAVKSGDLIGHVGHQSLDYQVWDTTKTLKGFLYPTAYNNTEPWKINTVAPLDYFTASVKAQILPFYSRKVAPLDGKIDYDVSGEAVGNWFQDGTNGYAGHGQGGSTPNYESHLAFAYDSIDPTIPELSIGDYQGQPTQFTVDGTVDWTKITPTSGVTKIQLKQGQQNQATALIQLTGKDNLKIELFPGKNPSQVNGFDGSAKTYNRGQNATLVKSTTAT